MSTASAPTVTPDRNRCTRCAQRLMPVKDTQPIRTRGLQVRTGRVYLKCRCGTWNPLPERLRLLLCIVLAGE